MPAARRRTTSRARRRSSTGARRRTAVRRESRLFYADYRDVSGVKLPSASAARSGADTIEETTFDNFRINPKIDPKKFEIKK